ncbi:hypothetical protein D1007_35142 [Hordeum vulgare]|nr:hypothetical protein D1007_35142 [Hordeum vulgare]
MCQIQSTSESPSCPLYSSKRQMAPAGKKGMATTSAVGTTAARPALMPSCISKAEDLGLVLPLVVGDTNEGGENAIRASSGAQSSLVKTVYPFFLHIIYPGLVLPFFDFFYAILSH